MTGGRSSRAGSTRGADEELPDTAAAGDRLHQMAGKMGELRPGGIEHAVKDLDKMVKGLQANKKRAQDEIAAARAELAVINERRDKFMKQKEALEEKMRERREKKKTLNEALRHAKQEGNRAADAVKAALNFARSQQDKLLKKEYEDSDLARHRRKNEVGRAHSRGASGTSTPKLSSTSQALINKN